MKLSVFEKKLTISNVVFLNCLKSNSQLFKDYILLSKFLKFIFHLLVSLLLYSYGLTIRAYVAKYDIFLVYKAQHSKTLKIISFCKRTSTQTSAIRNAHIYKTFVFISQWTECTSPMMITQNYTFFRLKLVVQTFEHSSNQSKFTEVIQVVRATNKKTIL